MGGAKGGNHCCDLSHNAKNKKKRDDEEANLIRLTPLLTVLLIPSFDVCINSPFIAIIKNKATNNELDWVANEN